jgi:hypothetical protein
MTVNHTKSTYIANLDASPVVQNTAGEGGPAPLISVEGYATAVAADAAGGTYQFVRVPSNCKLKSLDFESAAQGAGAISLGLYYATNGEGGQPTSLLLANAINSTLFASQINCASAVGITNEINQAGTFPITKRVQPLWQAAGLATDPGGFFDIVGTVDTTAITTGTGVMGLRATYAT